MTDGFRADVLRGLSLPQKAIPARWLYDARGSALFERIAQLPEYYPTRTEAALLGRRAGEIAALAGPGRAVVELGAGSAAKTPTLLAALDAPAAYVPVDIAGATLEEAAAALRPRFPALPVLPVAADFLAALPLPDAVRGLPMLGFFPGSTIGNLPPAAAVDLLRRLRAALGGEARLLIGMDLVKPVPVLLAAYDDAAGVTAEFNRNLLRRVNRELDGDLDPAAFRHRAPWNADHARIEMHLEATRDLRFTVAGRRFAMRAGETIHTENSHKYDRSSADALLRAARWEPRAPWTDERGWFALVLADAAPEPFAP